MRKEIADPTGRSFVFVWQVVAVETVSRPEHDALVGPHRLGHRGGAGRGSARRVPRPVAGRGPPDAVRARGAAEPEAPGRDRDAHQVAARHGRQLRRWRAPALVLRRRLHDPAHHASGRPTCCPIEAAIARLTSIPARAYGITDRGTLEAGKAGRRAAHRSRASLAPARRRATCATSRPASGRYVVDATGYHSVIVNGETLLRDGVDTGRRPGVVLRPFTGS